MEASKGANLLNAMHKQIVYIVECNKDWYDERQLHNRFSQHGARTAYNGKATLRRHLPSADK